MIDKFSVFGFTWFFISKVYNYVQSIERIGGQLCAYTVAVVCTCRICQYLSTLQP